MRRWMKAGLAVLAFPVAAELMYQFALRERWLTWGTTAEERAAQLPGDELMPRYTSDATHAITIDAPAEFVWPWLMQIGQDRSGFYSYTALENLVGCDMPCVERLVPEWTTRARGETVWFGTPKRFDAQAKMIAAVVERNHAFAMVSASDWDKLQAGQAAEEALWSFSLRPLSDGRTRLVVRLRTGTPKTVGARLLNRLFWEPMHFVMEHRMLHRIRALAEEERSLRL